MISWSAYHTSQTTLSHIDSSLRYMYKFMRGSRKFCQRGPNFDNVFFSLIRGGRIQISLLAGHQRPPAKRHLNGVSPVGRRWPNIECWLGSFVIVRDPDQYCYGTLFL